jgi:hypothetical protein
MKNVKKKQKKVNHAHKDTRARSTDHKNILPLPSGKKRKEEERRESRGEEKKKGSSNTRKPIKYGNSLINIKETNAFRMKEARRM